MASLRSIAHIALIFCFAATLSSAQGQAASNGKPEDQVAQLERDWLAADGKGDTASLRRIIADDFIGSSFNGGLLSKEDIIPERTGPGGFAGATPGETNVRVFGDTSVLMGVINTAGPESRQIRITLVCQKRPQGWQIIAAQMTHAQ
ncbi:MAG: nuclear transport factor 2 family protein [Candidatus Sulfotelmatobacter sp.]